MPAAYYESYDINFGYSRLDRARLLEVVDSERTKMDERITTPREGLDLVSDPQERRGRSSH